jgi:hypothetical protein
MQSIALVLATQSGFALVGDQPKLIEIGLQPPIQEKLG